jgi:hypothetical protein
MGRLIFGMMQSLGPGPIDLRARLIDLPFRLVPISLLFTDR